MTKLSDLSNPSNYPSWCCIQCLFKAGGKPIKLVLDEYIKGKCPVCGNRGDLVSPETFGYPVIEGRHYKEVEDWK